MSLVKIFIEDAQELRTSDQLALFKQKTANRRKEELFRDKTVLDVSEKILMHYIIMRCFILRRVGTPLLRFTES